ncbi:MAG: hypothetical protein WA747_00390 [Steroidobacteraceae bacterium]
MRPTRLVSLGLMAATVMSAAALTAQAQDQPPPAADQTQAPASGADLRCRMTFTLEGWSAIYQSAHGKGVVTCADGSSFPVLIRAKGGGLTAGKWQIDDGHGTFSDVHRPSEVLGRYAQGGAQAGVVKSAEAEVLTKGTVSLALAGRGHGVDLGVAVGEVTLSRAK